MPDSVAVIAVTHAHPGVVPAMAVDAEHGYGVLRMAHVACDVCVPRILSCKRLLYCGTVTPRALAVVMGIEFNRLGFVRVMAIGAVERVSAVHQSVTVAARGQVAVLDVAVIAFERRVHAPALFDALILRNVAGSTPATV